MKKPEVSPKALSAWLTAAMVGPVALVSASSSWLAVLVAVILCGLLCIAIFRFSGGLVWKNKGYCVVAILWNLYAAAVVAAQGSICWPGKGSELVIPLVLILLAALSAVSGAQNAAAVSGTLWPL